MNLRLETQALYVEAIQTLAKSTGNTASRKYIRSINGIHDKYEVKVLKVVQKALKSMRNRFVQKFRVDNIVGLFEKLKKSESDDVRAEILKIIESSLVGVDLASDIVDELKPLIDELTHSFASVHDVDLNFDLVNQRAVDYLEKQAKNNFSTLADDQAKGIFAKIADVMSSDEGYTIKDVAQGIKESFGGDSLYFETADGGSREIDATDWSMLTARTETARAASDATRAITDELGLNTWTWATQDTGCDECDSNDGEVVAVGDNFPSGDTEPPAHPQCRCVVTVTLDELTAVSSEDTPSEE